MTCPQKCGPEEMSCWGGKDPNECTMPDFCIPMKGNPGHDGTECQVSCPVKCGSEEMSCYGGSDYNGCQYGDFCWPTKGDVYEFIKVVIDNIFIYFFSRSIRL